METTKTGNQILKKVSLAIAMLAIVFGWDANARAGDVEFVAELDRYTVSLDDSVSLKMSIKVEGANSAGEPTFLAPDFEIVNQYSGTYVESFYENGKFGMRNTLQVTKVLKPLKQGTLIISDIRVKVNGTTYNARDLKVMVGGSGTGTPPPKNYGGSGVGLRGSAKPVSGRQVLVRVELDKQKIVKGEQVIVSYYLYRRARVFNIQVEKYPILNGFLREDLEMPVLGTRLDSERVMLDGVPYDRSLLVRYAAYPLQEGKLKIDSMGLKYNYYGSQAGRDDGEDPFANFFQALTPMSGSGRSEVATIEVGPIPNDGRPASFSGGVGDFTVTSAVDKYDTRVNEAINLKVKIEGRGNLAAVGEPKASWPSSIEIYESKGVAKPGRGGVGEKVFEYVLIPRAQGKVDLPAMEFSFYDPNQKKFVTRHTEPISINVGEAQPGSTNAIPSRAQTGTSQPLGASQSSSGNEIRPFKAPEAMVHSGSAIPIWRGLYWLCIAGFLGFVGLVSYDLIRFGRGRAREQSQARAKIYSKSFEKLKQDARQAQEGAAWQAVLSAYERLTGAVFDALDRNYNVGARSLPRGELGRVLVEENGLSEDTWKRIARLLEFAETVRFASQAGAVSENTARHDLMSWVSEGEILMKSLTPAPAEV